MNIVQAAADLVWSPVLRRFPDLMKHFRYDPFEMLGGRENCTVGALRTRAAGHDVAIRSVNAANIGKHAARSVDLSVPG